MSAAVCPACGVAVMPGYVRCPNKRCRKPLPRRMGTAIEGGTAVEQTRRWPLFAVLGVAAVVIGLIIYWGAGGDDKPAAPPPVVTTDEPAPVETLTPVEPSFTDPQPTTREPERPDPTAIAASLERDLKRARLWSTVTVTGTRVDIRSGSCGDSQMAPLLESAGPAFKAAGLTKLRCVEQSGRVVSDRDL